MTKHKSRSGRVVYFYPKGARRIDSVPGPYRIAKDCPLEKMESFDTRSGARSKSTIASQERAG